MALLFNLPRSSQFDANGELMSGWVVSFYETQTTTPKSVYPTYADAVARTNSIGYQIPAGDDGSLRPIYLDDSGGAYKVVITDSSGNVVPNGTIDPYLVTFTQAQVSQALNPRTEAEAAVTTLSTAIPSHATEGFVNVFRYLTQAQRDDVVNRSFTLDVSDGIQAAIDVASELIETLGGATVYMPQGTYRLETPITVPSSALNAGMHIRGAGKTTTILKSFGITDKVMIIGDLTRQTLRGTYSDFCVDGNNEADYGIYGARVEEHDFVRVWCRMTQVAGMSIGYGYVNNYHQVECSYNQGDGLVFNTDHGTANNANTLSQCLLFANEGWGFKGRGGHGLWIKDCTIEQNKAGGVLNGGITGCYINGYFEGNALTGHTFTTPPLNIKADIIFTGGSYTEMTAAFAVQGAVVESCVTDPRVGSHSFVWNGGVNDLTIRNCKTNQPTYVPVLGEHYSAVYKGSGVIIENCTNFNDQIEYFGAAVSTNNNFAAYTKIVAPTMVTARRNYAQTDLNQWSVISAGGSNTYRRSQGGATLYRFNQTDVWEIVTAATGESDIHGFALTAENYPELIGKQMWFGMWCYITDADCYLQPFCSEQSFNPNPTALNAWTFLAVSFTWPASGTVAFGARKVGTASSGSAYFAAPMLSRLGVPQEECIACIPQFRHIWRGSAMPTAGAWEDGDFVDNTSASLDGSNLTILGWKRLTTGTGHVSGTDWAVARASHVSPAT